MNDPTKKDEQLSEALNAAYPAHQPGEQLQGRMVEAERSHRLQSYSRKTGWKKGWLTLIGGLALLSVVGFSAYKYFFDRPGEAAIALIPADADFVVTLDTNPSAQQLATFQKIGMALHKEGILEKLDDTLTAVLNQNPVAKRIRPFVSKNMALAVWMPSVGFDKGPEPDGAFFLALTKPGEVDSILSESIPNDNNRGFTVYNVDKKVFGAVIGNYLVVGPNPDILEKIHNVSTGSGQSVAQLPEYQNARASLAADANLMAFVSPDVLSVMDQGKGKGPNPLAGIKWMAMGMALRDAGLEFTYQCPMNQAKLPSLKHLAGIAPVDANVLRKLPGGAYGVLTYSQAGKYWDFITETVAQDPNVKNEMDKGLAEFEKETGMSIPRDVVPAFGGNLTLAIYPSPTMGADSADGIVVIDDAHGANPAALADKFRLLAEKESAKDGKPIKFVPSKQGEATIWRLDAASQARMTKGIAPRHDMAALEVEMQEPQVGIRMSPDAPKLSPEDAAEIREMQEEMSKPPAAMKDKTLIYAQVGNSVIIASSEAMMTRALQSYQGGGTSLADDTAFAGMLGRINDRSQSMMLVNLHGILEAMRPHIEQQMAGKAVQVDDVINVFGGPSTGLVISGYYDGNVAIGEMFLPLDYQRLITILARSDKDKNAKTQSFSFKDAPRLAPVVARTGNVLARL